MDKQLQQRLTGAAIIVALAVIFIPELIEQPELDRTPAPAPAIPPPSDTPTTTISLDPPEEPPAHEVAIDGSGVDESGSGEMPSGELPELPPLAEADAPLEEVAPVDPELPFDQPEPMIEEPPPATAARLPEPPPAAPAPPPRPPVSRSDPPAPRRPDPPPPPRREPPPAPERVATIAPPPEPALPKLELISRPMGQSQPTQTQPRWMVQAGSFSDLDNANSLRARLQSSNFSTSLQQTVVDGRTMYRVHIGPHSSRDEGERTRERLRRELNINGSVVPVYN